MHPELIQPLLTVEEAAGKLGIRRSLMWRLVSTREVESLHIGRLRRITVEALDRYIAKRSALGSPVGR